MPKQNKQKAAATRPIGPSDLSNAGPHAVVHAPTKQPTLLAVSMALFALWFVFLLVTALSS
jgi:hypothetical protein